MARVLIVDADREFAALTREELEAAEHSCIDCAEIGEALCICRDWLPHAVLLDMDAVVAGGLRVLEQIREICSAAIIVAMSLHGPQGRRQALELAADDYITKPFEPEELTMRIEAIGRRTAGPEPAASKVVHVNELRVDVTARRAWVHDVELDLTPHERALLLYFIANRSRVLGRDELLHAVWGADFTGAWDLLRQTVYTLRRKIEGRAGSATEWTKYIKTIHAEGYLFR